MTRIRSYSRNMTHYPKIHPDHPLQSTIQALLSGLNDHRKERSQTVEEYVLKVDVVRKMC